MKLSQHPEIFTIKMSEALLWGAKNGDIDTVEQEIKKVNVT